MTDSRSELMALAVNREELLYLADQQAHVLGMLREDDAGEIRESKVIEYALRLAASQPDREMVARVVAEQLGECWERLVDEHLNPSFCKEDFRRCADAILFLLVGGDQKKLNSDCQHQTEQSGKQPSAPLHIALHEDRIEKLDHVFYLRWTSGPDYERVFLCIEDGEPDMHDLATLNYKQARVFAEAYRAAQHATEAPQRWRHIKRGSEYTLVGNAQVQAEDPLTDYEIVVVYKGPGGLWVRRKSEFYDGRFEAVAETDSRDSSECSPREVFADPNPAPPAGGR